MSEANPYAITPALDARRAHHGAHSEYKVRATAKNQKRTILRKLGVRAGDVDAVASVFIDVLARSLAKAQILDSYYAERGILREDGSPEPSLALYLGFLNQSRLTAQRLGEHMARQGSRAEDLHDYLDARYGSNGG